MPPVLAGGDGDDVHSGAPSARPQQEERPASWTPPVVDVGEVHAPSMGHAGGGGAPRASLEQQPATAMLAGAAGETEAPTVTTVSATREPSGADGAARRAARGPSRVRARSGGRARRSSPSRVPRGRQGCITVPTSTPEPAVYAVDEEGVGSLPPTESFARGERRHTDEPMVVTL